MTEQRERNIVPEAFDYPCAFCDEPVLKGKPECSCPKAVAWRLDMAAYWAEHPPKRVRSGYYS